MKLSLRGIYSKDILTELNILDDFGFDLRPRSFNFTQMRVISEMIENLPSEKSISLLFENEKDFVIKSSIDILKPLLHNKNNILVELSGEPDFESFEKLEENYSYRLVSEVSFRKFESLKFLKKIILDHKLLELYDTKGELHGFLNILKDLDVEFELLLDWDTCVIASMFEYFQFHYIGFELSSKVESSFRNPDIAVIKSLLESIEDLELEKE